MPVASTREWTSVRADAVASTEIVPLKVRWRYVTATSATALCAASCSGRRCVEARGRRLALHPEIVVVLGGRAVRGAASIGDELGVVVDGRLPSGRFERVERFSASVGSS
jgi:hypothetical protein